MLTNVSLIYGKLKADVMDKLNKFSLKTKITGLNLVMFISITKKVHKRHCLMSFVE